MFTTLALTSRSTIGVYFYFRFDIVGDSEANALGSVSRLAGIERATGDSPRRSKPIYNTYRGAASPETFANEIQL